MVSCGFPLFFSSNLGAAVRWTLGDPGVPGGDAERAPPAVRAQRTPPKV
jgi:hypothetical protein